MNEAEGVGGRRGVEGREGRERGEGKGRGEERLTKGRGSGEEIRKGARLQSHSQAVEVRLSPASYRVLVGSEVELASCKHDLKWQEEETE
eukprot:165033-Hanusia_phi.AAC.2